MARCCRGNARIGALPHWLARPKTSGAPVASWPSAAWLHGCCWDLSDGSGCFIPKDSMARFDEVFASLSEELGAVTLDEEEERELFQQPFARAQRAEAEVERLRAELLDASCTRAHASPTECIQCRARVVG